jgi:hypothetical protein
MLPTAFEVDQFYSNEEFHRALNVGTREEFAHAWGMMVK